MFSLSLYMSVIASSHDPTKKIIALHPSRKVISGKVQENGAPLNLTLKSNFTVYENLDDHSLEFEWLINNEDISHKLKTSENISFVCNTSTIFIKDEPHNGSVQLNIYNIDKAFTEIVVLKVFKVYKNISERIEIASKSMTVKVTKEYKVVPLMQFERPKILRGELLKLDASKVLSKGSGKPEIESCEAEILMKTKSHSIFVKVIQIEQLDMMLNDNEFILKTDKLPKLQVRLRCKVVIDNLHIVPFFVEFDVRNLIVAIVDGVIKCRTAISLIGFDNLKFQKFQNDRGFRDKRHSEILDNKAGVEVRDGTFSCMAVNADRTEFLFDKIEIRNGTVVIKNKLRPCNESEPQQLECDELLFPFKSYCCKLLMKVRSGI